MSNPRLSGLQPPRLSPHRAAIPVLASRGRAAHRRNAEPRLAAYLPSGTLLVTIIRGKVFGRLLHAHCSAWDWKPCTPLLPPAHLSGTDDAAPPATGRQEAQSDPTQARRRWRYLVSNMNDRHTCLKSAGFFKEAKRAGYLMRPVTEGSITAPKVCYTFFKMCVTCPKYMYFRGSKQWRGSMHGGRVWKAPSWPQIPLKLAVNPVTVNTSGCVISKWANGLVN